MKLKPLAFLWPYWMCISKCRHFAAVFFPLFFALLISVRTEKDIIMPRSQSLRQVHNSMASVGPMFVQTSWN